MDHTRHVGIFDASRLDVTLIGVGGIGAITAVTLGKMGVYSLLLVDDDIIEQENIATQLLPVLTIGQRKARVVGDLVHYFSDDPLIWQLHARIDEETDPEEITNQLVISAVDSIKARKDIWEAVKKTHTQWYFDARMSSESFLMYAVYMGDPRECWKYDDVLAHQDDESIPDEPCTSKATFYTAAIAAGMIGNHVRKMVTGQKIPFLVAFNIKDLNLLVV